MEASMRIRNALSEMSNSEIWIELAKRLGVRFGRVQMIFHNGKPSKYVNVDMKVNAENGNEAEQPVQDDNR